MAIDTSTGLPEPEAPHRSPFSDERAVKYDLTGRDLVVTYFAAVLLLLIAGLCISFVWDSHLTAPDLRHMTPAEQKEAIEHYKDLSSAIVERTEKMFDLVVVKALLPLVATLIGYLIGKEARRS